MRSIVGALCLSLQPLALNALSVPVMAYIIHRLGPESYAQWMVAVSLLAVGAVLTNLGLRSAFIRTIAANPAVASVALAEQLGLRIVLSMFAGAVVVSACLLLGYSSTIVWCAMVGAAGLALITIATTLADLLQSVHHNTVLAAASMVSGLVLTGVSLVAAWQGAGPVEMALAYLIGPALLAATLLVIVRRHVCAVAIQWSPSAGYRLLRGSRFFAAQQLLFAASSQIEALMLPRLIGMGQFGVFTAGAMPANRLMAIPDGLSGVAYPTLVRAWTRGSTHAASLARRYALVAALGGILIATGGMLVAEPIGRLLLPDHAALFAMVVQITIWSLPLTALELVMGYTLNACGQDAAQARRALPSAATSLLCSVSLVWAFGLTGACWSMVFRPLVRGAFLVPLVLQTFRQATSAPSAVTRRADASADLESATRGIAA